MKSIFGVAFALFGAAVAADEHEPLFPDRPLDFSLRLSQHTLDLDYGGSRIDTSLDRAALLWRERYGTRLQLGLIIGYTSLTQTNNAATAGRELNGYHGGFSLDWELLRLGQSDIFVSADWIYQKVDYEYGGQKVVIVTREPNAQIGAGFRPVDNVRAYAGVRYGDIDGEQRQSGTVNETRKIKSAREAGGFAGAEFLLRDGGYIRLDAESAADRSVAISFGKRY